MVRTGEHSGFLVGWNDGLGWIFVQGGRTKFSPADYYIPHIHPINNLWGGISPSRRGVPCWFVLCPLKYLRETMLLLRVAPRRAERCRGAAERTGRCLHLSPQMFEGWIPQAASRVYLKNSCFYAARFPRPPAVIFSLLLTIPHLFWLSSADAKVILSQVAGHLLLLKSSNYSRLVSKEIPYIRIQIVLFNKFNTKMALYSRHFTSRFHVFVYQAACQPLPSLSPYHLSPFSLSRQIPLFGRLF